MSSPNYGGSEGESPDYENGEEANSTDESSGTASERGNSLTAGLPSLNEVKSQLSGEEENASESRTAEEQVQDVKSKVQKIQKGAQVAQSIITSIVNPVTGIVALVALAIILGLMAIIALNQTVGRNDNACRNGEDCSIAEILEALDGACGGTVSLVGNDNIEKAYNYMVGKGYPPAMAAGIAGNFKAESGAIPWIAEIAYPDPPAGWVTGLYDRPGGVEDRVGGWGIGQWSFGRHAALREYIKEKLGPKYYVSQHTDGQPPMDSDMEDTLLGAQLDFMLTGEPAERANINAVRSAKTPEAAARIFHDRWERSAGWNPIRAEYAREIFDRQGGSASGTQGSAVIVCDQGGGPVGALCGAAPNPYNGSVPKSPAGQTKPQMTHTRDELLRLCSTAMPPTQSCPGDTVNRNSFSGHYWGVACDIFPKGALFGRNSCANKSSPACRNGNSIAAWLIKYHAELKVLYVIWDGKIWSGPSWTARNYGGCGPTVCNSSPTALHQDHVHVSMMPGP